jgi:hypothetical protein
MASSSPSPFHVPHPATPVLASWLMGRLASPPVNTLPRISSLVRPAAVPRKFWSACKVSSVRYRYMGRRKQLPQSLGFGPRKVGWLNPRAIHSNVCALQSLPSVESLHSRRLAWWGTSPAVERWSSIHCWLRAHANRLSPKRPRTRRRFMSCSSPFARNRSRRRSTPSQSCQARPNLSIHKSLAVLQPHLRPLPRKTSLGPLLRDRRIFFARSRTRSACQRLQRSV